MEEMEQELGSQPKPSSRAQPLKTLLDLLQSDDQEVHKYALAALGKIAMSAQDKQLLVMKMIHPSLEMTNLPGILGAAGATAAVWTTAGWPSTPWGG